MNGAGRRCRVGLLATVLLACRVSGESSATPADADDPPSATEVFVAGSGTGATEDEARAAALDALAEALLGDSGWREMAAVDIHDRATDPYTSEDADGAVRVTVGLSRSRAAAVLASFALAEPRVGGPDAWHDTIYAFLFAHAAVVVCERRQVLFGTPCEPGDTTEADAALDEVARDCVLAPAWAGGVPVDGDHHAVRPPAVVALWRGVPLEGVPVVATGPAGLLGNGRGSTDALGRITFEVASDVAWADPIEVAVDAAALLGPLHEQWPVVELAVKPRTIGLDRWTALVTERSAGDPVDDAVVGPAITEALGQHGMDAPVSVPAGDRASLIDASARGREDAFGGVADALGGALDVVMVVDADSGFASRMGGNRVWYEAHGTLVAHDVWSGRVLASVKRSVEASGIGDARADAAARRELGGALVEALLQSPGVSSPRPGVAAVRR